MNLFFYCKDLAFLKIIMFIKQFLKEIVDYYIIKELTFFTCYWDLRNWKIDLLTFHINKSRILSKI